MFKLAFIAAMYSLSATCAVFASSDGPASPYPMVVDRAVGNSGANAVESTTVTPVVVGSEDNVFEVMRQRRLTASTAEAAPVDEFPEVIIAEEVDERPMRTTDPVPDVAPAEKLDKAVSAGGLYQRNDQTLGGASGSDSLEPVGLEERADSPRSVTVYASDKAANILYERDATPIKQSDGRLGFGFLFSESRDNVFTGNLMLDVYPDLVPGIRLSAGLRAYAALLGAENQDVVGIGLGFEGAYLLPTKILPLELSAGFYYTPDIFVFGQSDRIIDYNVRAGFQLRDSLHAFAGLRFLQFDTRPGDREVDDNIHVGLRWDFVR